MDLARTDTSQNIRRFYRMEIVPGLFGNWSLVREWGRIGQGGQIRVDWFPTEAAAHHAQACLLTQKGRRGYTWPAVQGG